MKKTNVRFYDKNPEDMRAWEILHNLDKTEFKSQNAFVVRAIIEYHDRHCGENGGPFLESKEKEDAFTDRIVEAVERKVFANLPAMVGIGYMQAVMNGNTVSVANQTMPEVSGRDGNDTGKKMAEESRRESSYSGQIEGVFQTRAVSDRSTIAADGNEEAMLTDDGLLDTDTFGL